MSYIPVFITTLHVKDIKIMASFYAESIFKIIRGAIENMVIWKSAVLRKQTNSFEGGISCSLFSCFSTVKSLCLLFHFNRTRARDRESARERNSLPLLQNTFLFIKLLHSLSFFNQGRVYLNSNPTQNHGYSI